MKEFCVDYTDTRGAPVDLSLVPRTALKIIMDVRASNPDVRSKKSILERLRELVDWKRN